MQAITREIVGPRVATRQSQAYEFTEMLARATAVLVEGSSASALADARLVLARASAVARLATYRTGAR
jgi:hypothetical protein